MGLTNVFGSWLVTVYGLTQHAGLAENVLDHRLNCRTVYMNPVNRFLYWNMNYHVEHHMFPLVPYHALPRLHEVVKDDMPEPYPSVFAAWREIVPTVLRQVRDPAYCVKRRIPDARPGGPIARPIRAAGAGADGWIEVCAAADLGPDDVIRFDHGRRTYALCRDAGLGLHATDGVCTHGNTHLANGLVKGGMIECPKHNGRFNLADGSPARAPVCRGLATYPIEERGGRLWLNVLKGGRGRGPHAEDLPPPGGRATVASRPSSRSSCSSRSSPARGSRSRPGDYMQIDIPSYGRIHFREFDIPEPYSAVWEAQHVFDLEARNPATGRRNNYSLASNRQLERSLRFNVRIATPPPGQDCPPGVGSAYVFNLRPGDTVTAIGPFRGLPHQADGEGDGLHWRRRRDGAAARAHLPPV